MKYGLFLSFLAGFASNQGDVVIGRIFGCSQNFAKGASPNLESSET